MLQLRIALLMTATILMAAMWSSDQTKQVEAARNLVTTNRVMYHNQLPHHPQHESSSYSGTSITRSKPAPLFCMMNRDDDVARNDTMRMNWNLVGDMQHERPDKMGQFSVCVTAYASR